MMTLHTYFCGDEITQNLIDHVSVSYYCRDILLWANHEAGAIVPLQNDDRLYFVSYSYTPGDICNLMKNHQDGNEENTCPMVAEGILGQWLRLKPEDCFQKEYRPSRQEQEELDEVEFEKPMTPLQIFEEYFNICKQRYKDTHQFAIDAWRKDLDKEFVTKVHLNDERLKAENSKAIFPYFRKADIDKLKDVLDNYMMFVQSRANAYSESEVTLESFVIYPQEVEIIASAIRAKIQDADKPKNRALVIRAAIDAGKIRHIPYESFHKLFPSVKISDTTYNNYVSTTHEILGVNKDYVDTLKDYFCRLKEELEQ